VITPRLLSIRGPFLIVSLAKATLMTDSSMLAPESGAKDSDMPKRPVRTVTNAGSPESPLVKICSTEPIFSPSESTTVPPLRTMLSMSCRLSMEQPHLSLPQARDAVTAALHFCLFVRIR
jgi:hypothetical protein